jgi:hypothetical protein
MIKKAIIGLLKMGNDQAREQPQVEEEQQQSKMI